MRPERLCHELTRHVPDDAIVVVDTGHAGMWMGGMFDLKSPRQSYMRSAGHLGWAFPAGLGAKCACPDRPVVTFTGDAGFWYHIAEIETAARWNINAVTVVNNNGGGNQSKRGFDRVYGGQQTAEGARIVDLQQGQFRPPRRGHGRARHPRRAGRRRFRRHWRRRSPQIVPPSSTWSPISRRWRRPLWPSCRSKSVQMRPISYSQEYADSVRIPVTNLQLSTGSLTASFAPEKYGKLTA